MAKKGDFEIRGVLSLDDADLDKEHKVQLKVDAKSAFGTILNINQRLDLLEKTPRSIKLELNAKEVTEKLDKIDGYLKQLRADTKRGNVIKITADTASIRGSIAMLEGKLKALNNLGKIKVSLADGNDVADKITATAKAVKGIKDDKSIKVTFDTKNTIKELTSLDSILKNLVKSVNIPVKAEGAEYALSYLRMIRDVMREIKAMGQVSPIGKTTRTAMVDSKGAKSVGEQTSNRSVKVSSNTSVAAPKVEGDSQELLTLRQQISSFYKSLDLAYQAKDNKLFNTLLKGFESVKDKFTLFGKKTGTASEETEIRELTKRLSKPLLPKEERDSLIDRIAELKNAIDARKREISIRQQSKLPAEDTIATLSKQLSSARTSADKALQLHGRDSSEYSNAVAKFQELQTQLANFKADLKGAAQSADGKSAANGIGAIASSTKTASNAVKEINNNLLKQRQAVISAAEALDKASSSTKRDEAELSKLRATLDSVTTAYIKLKRESSKQGLSLSGEKSLLSSLIGDRIGNGSSKQTNASTAYFSDRVRALNANIAMQNSKRDISDTTGATQRIATAVQKVFEKAFGEGFAKKLVANFSKSFEAVGGASGLLSLGGRASKGVGSAVEAFAILTSRLQSVGGAIGGAASLLGIFALGISAVGAAIYSLFSIFTMGINAIESFGRALYDSIIGPGLRYNATMQSGQLATAAGVMSSFTLDGKKIGEDVALAISGAIKSRIETEALNTNLDPQELMKAYAGIAPLAAKKGWNAEQIVSFSSAVGNVAKMTGIQSNQLLQESRDLLQGTITTRNSQVANILGLTNADIKQAQANGEDLFDFLASKLDNYSAMAQKFPYTIGGALDQLREAYGKSMGLATEGLTKDIVRIEQEILGLVGTLETVQKKDSRGNFIRNEAGEIETEQIWKIDESKIAPLKQFVEAVIDIFEKYIRKFIGYFNLIYSNRDAVDTILVLVETVISATEWIAEIFVDMLSVVSDVISMLKKLNKAFGGAIYELGGYFSDAILLVFRGAKMLIQIVAMLGEALADWASSGWSVAVENFSKKYSAFSKSTATSTNKVDYSIPKSELSKEVSDFIDKMIQIAKNIDLTKVRGTAVSQEDTKTARKALQKELDALSQMLRTQIEKLKNTLDELNNVFSQSGISIKDYYESKSKTEQLQAQLTYDTAAKKLETITNNRAAYSTDEEYDKAVESARQELERSAITLESANKNLQEVATISNALNKNVLETKHSIDSGFGTLASILSNKSTSISSNSTSISSSSNSGALLSILDSSFEKYVGMSMDNLENGCVEAVTKMGSAYNSFLQKELDNGVVNVDALIEDAIASGIRVIPYTEGSLQAGDIAVFGDNDHVGISRGGDRLYHNSSSKVQVQEESLQNMDDVTAVIKTGLDGLVDTFISTEEAVANARKLIADANAEKSGLDVFTTQKGSTEYKKAVEAMQIEVLKTVIDSADSLGAILPEGIYTALADAEASSLKKKIAVNLKYFTNILGDGAKDILENASAMLEESTRSKTSLAYADTNIKRIEEILDAIGLEVDREAVAVYNGYKSINEAVNDMHKAITERTEKFLANIRSAMAQAAASGNTDLYAKLKKKYNEVVKTISDSLEKLLSKIEEQFDLEAQLSEATTDSDLVRGLRSRIIDYNKYKAKEAVAREHSASWRAEYSRNSARIDELTAQLSLEIPEEEKKKIEAEIQTLSDTNVDLKVNIENADKVAELNKRLAESQTWLKRLEKTAKQAIEDGLVTFLTDGVNEAESLGEALRNLAVGILKELQQFFAKELVTGLMSAFSGGRSSSINSEKATAENTGQLVNTTNYMSQQLEEISAKLDTLNTQSEGAQTETEYISEAPGFGGVGGINTFMSNSLLGFGQTSGIGASLGSVVERTLGGVTNAITSVVNQITSFMNNGVFVKLFSSFESLIGSAGVQLAGMVTAIDAIVSGDKKEQLLGMIFLELQLIYVTLTTSVLSAISSLATSFSSSSFVGGYATGGYISGPGTSTSDSIPSMLSNGEYVIKADSVRKWGKGFLDAVNNGDFASIRARVPKFATGGFVGNAGTETTARGLESFANNVGTSVSNTTKLNVALVKDEQEAVRHFMRSGEGQRIMLDFTRNHASMISSVLS